MNQELVKLKCVKEGQKLRMKIIYSGYSSLANCQCPRDIRIEGKEYTVPKEDITLANMRGKFFYRIKKDRIVLYQPVVDLNSLKIYDEGVTECCICLEENVNFIIFAPCGHCCTCHLCANKLKQCPLCRADISQIVTKDQLQ